MSNRDVYIYDNPLENLTFPSINEKLCTTNIHQSNQNYTYPYNNTNNYYNQSLMGLSNRCHVTNLFNGDNIAQIKKDIKEPISIYTTSSSSGIIATVENNVNESSIIPLFDPIVWNPTNWKQLAAIAQNSCHQSITDPLLYNQMIGINDNGTNKVNTINSSSIDQTTSDFSVSFTPPNLSNTNSLTTYNNSSTLFSSNFNDSIVNVTPEDYLVN
ncbi:paired mesoderm homeobox protein 2 [Schistosoma japonicum]|nr:paired mesoderm homeobox protein 2 [Schistosoma japonicum]